jgi:anti-sigma B factor antagonist
VTLATISVDPRAPAIVARVSGEIDLSNAHDLGQQILDAVPSDAAGLVLDLVETHYLDSAGVRLVFEVASRLRDRGQTLVIAATEGTPVRRILELTEVGQVAQLHDDGATALATLTNERRAGLGRP